MAKLKIRNLNKNFAKTAILKDINLEVEDGECVVLVGPSGCGKSTLLRIIAGLESPSNGAISIDGQDISALAPQHRDVAMVFQSYALYPHMTVRENMALALVLRKESKSSIQRKVHDTAELLDIANLLERLPKELSGGQRQRVAMGRAIVRNPKLFLFDEPLSNLDAELRNRMRTDIKKLQKKLGVTTIYVTHDQVEAMTIADRIVVLKHGEIQQLGTPMDLFRNPANRFVGGFLGSPAMNFLPAIWQGSEINMQNSPIAGFASNLPYCAEPRPIFLGVRPDCVRVNSSSGHAPAGVTWPAIISALEPLGTQMLVEVGTLKLKVMAQIPYEESLRIGQEVQVCLPAEHLHFFDGESGRAIPH